MTLVRNMIAGCAIVVASLTAVFAEGVETPVSEVVLTVSGNLSSTNDGKTAQFDMDMLRALDEKSFTTTTPWTEGKQTFTGVPLKTLLDVLGVEEGGLKATAINDYSVEIPVSDAVENGPIIAYLRNGKPMSVRDKGPLWIVYPYDADEKYQAEVIYSRSIWQLDRLEVSD